VAIPLLGAFGCATATEGLEGPDNGASVRPEAGSPGPEAGAGPGLEQGPAPRATPRALASEALSELSGLVVDGDGLRFGGLRFWGHNDHGNAPWLYGIGAGGQHLGRRRVDGVSAVDWEDASALGRGDNRLLLIGDIGDNLRRRRVVSVHFLPWPRVGDGPLRPVARLDFTYPGGPQDAEGLAWDALEGALYILTKRETPPRLYRLAVPPELARVRRGDAGGRARRDGCRAGRAHAEAEACGTPNPVTAEVVARLELPPPPLSVLFTDARRHLVYNLPTALDISRDGLRLAVLTYGALYLYDRRAGQGWQEALRRRPQIVRLPDLPQAEAVALHGEARHATVGSEGPGAAIVHLALPPRSVTQSR